jgi:hypothetical protein
MHIPANNTDCLFSTRCARHQLTWRAPALPKDMFETQLSAPLMKPGDDSSTSSWRLRESIPLKACMARH